MKERVAKYFPLVALCLILAITFLVYSPGLKNNYLEWDDMEYIINNKDVHSLSSEGVKKFFVTPYNGSYIPLTALSWAIEIHFFGFNPMVHILNNILLHLICTVFVFLFVQRLFKNSIYAIITSMVFALHPTHVESVAWITERKDVLFGAFFMISLYLYLIYKEKRELKWYIFSIILFFLALSSKTQAVTLIGCIVLIDLYQGEKIRWSYLPRILPFLVLGITFSILTLWAQGILEGAKQLYSYSRVNRIILASYSFTRYLSLSFLPINLSAAYPLPKGVPPSYYMIGLVVVGGYFYLMYKLFKKNQTLFFAMGFFLLNIAIILDSSRFTNFLLADRFLYIPIIGFGIFLSWLLYNKITISTSSKRNVVIAITLLLSGTYAYLTHARVKLWNNDQILFEDAIKKYPKNPIVLDKLGSFFLRNKQYERAIEKLNKSIKYFDKYPMSWGNRGIAYYHLRKYDSAYADLKEGLRYEIPTNKPFWSDMHYYFGSIYHEKAVKDSAIFYYKESLKIDSTNQRPKKGLVVSFIESKELDSAQYYLNKFKFTNQDTKYFLQGYIFMEAGQKDKALKEFNKAIKLYPKDYNYFAKRGRLYARDFKNFDAAISDFKRALKIDKKNNGLYCDLGNVYAIKGDFDNAILAYQKSVEINPLICYVHVNLGLALKSKNRMQEAIVHFQKGKDLGCSLPPDIEVLLPQQISSSPENPDLKKLPLSVE